MAEQMTEHRYTAVCTREEGAWVIEVPELPKVHTWAPDLRRARKHAAEAIAVWLDVDPSDVDVELDVSGADEELHQLRADRVALDEAKAAAAYATARAVHRLASLGVSDRDAAVAVGLSHQRIQQLRTKDRLVEAVEQAEVFDRVTRQRAPLLTNKRSKRRGSATG
jgi:predicted RNase H-like HicB family nuclease